MRKFAAVAFITISAASADKRGARQHNLEAAWASDLNPDTKVKTYTSPVKRVTNLLAKMKAELQAESDKEAEMYDKMVCWCESNEKEKNQAVADADAKDKELSAEVENRAARFGDLSASIANSKNEIAENTEALKQATAIREDEAAKFRDEENFLVQTITNLRNAIAVLSKHQKTQALLQMDGPVLSSLRVILRDAALKYEEISAGREESEGPRHMSLLALKREISRASGSGTQGMTAVLMSALDVKDKSVSDIMPVEFAARLIAKEAEPARTKGKFLQVDDAQPLYESRSSARSAGIYGVLNEMLDEFQAELSREQKEEQKAQGDYQALASAKSSEIDAGKKKLDEMESEDAGNRKALSDAKEDLSLTREQRSADVTFLQNLQTQCNDLDTQWQKRSHTRAAETQAVSEAIAILTEDDNREMLHKSVSLLQQQSSIAESSEVSAARASAAGYLRHAASSPGFQADDLLAAWHGRRTATVGAAAGPHAQLSTLAMAVQLDSFTKVKEMMDKMLANLKQEQADEVDFKAYCLKELDTTGKTTYDKKEVKRDLEDNINQLDSLIAKLDGEISEAKAQIASSEAEIKKSSQTRESENSEFQRVVSDQRATQSILKKALQKLKDFYQKGIGNKVALAQRTAQEPPVKFNSYKSNAGSVSVIGLIEQIISDSQALETETTTAESTAQADYEKFVKDSNAMIKSLQVAIAAKTRAIAGAHGDRAEASADLENTIGELESLSAYTSDLHNQCDFVLKNFDIRQKGRLQEMEAIQAAKAILSGAK